MLDSDKNTGIRGPKGVLEGKIPKKEKKYIYI